MYNKFKKLKLDTSYIGLIDGNVKSEYFCTPVGTTVIGWEGVDGIHFGFIDDFNDMVFAINPMTCADKYVYPLAENFEVFIKLLLSAKSANQLEQIINLDSETQYATKLIEENIMSEQQYLLDTLASELNVKPASNVFDYVKLLQQNFDYSKLKYSDAYYEVLGLEKP